MASITRHEFTGHEGIDQTGLWLVNMNGRIYNTSGSMFYSADPRIPHRSNSLSYNRYAYVNYNLLTYTDPTGFDDNDGDNPDNHTKADISGGNISSDGQQRPGDGSGGGLPGSCTGSKVTCDFFPTSCEGTCGNFAGMGGSPFSGGGDPPGSGGESDGSQQGTTDTSKSDSEPDPRENQSDEAQDPEPRGSPGDDQLERVVVNAPRTVVPNQYYGPADLTGIFPCGA
ncbi:MAG TPA: RHS repeat-associated core domain-containing protein, partial [Candidatus Eisenbacteria bacterium]|nr:RHS repeat-associated core domain-containing protein [Candidatus Eisenbacteria bacterium]